MFCVLFASAFLLILILKCFVWLILWYLKRFKKIKVSLESHSFLWIKNISFSVGPHLCLFLSNIWISSSYWNSSYRKPLVLCLSGLKIEQTLKRPSATTEKNKHNNKKNINIVGDDDDDHDQGGDDDDGSHREMQNGLLGTFLQFILQFFAKFISLHLENASICFKVDYNGDLIQLSSLTFQSFDLEVNKWSRGKLSVNISSSKFSICLVPREGGLVDEAGSGCMTTDLNVMVEFKSFSDISVESVEVECPNLEIVINEKTFQLHSYLRAIKNLHRNDVIGHDDDDVFVVDESEDSPSKKTRRSLARFVPKELKVKIIDAIVLMVPDSTDRDVMMTCRKLTLETRLPRIDDHTTNELKATLVVLQLAISTGPQELVSVQQLSSNLFISKEEMTTGLDFRDLHVNYRHDDVAVLVEVFRKLPARESKFEINKTNSKPSKVGLLMTSLLKMQQKKFELTSSGVVLHVESIFVFGLPTFRLSVVKQSSDCTIDLEATSSYLRMVTNNNNNTGKNNEDLQVEISAKRHSWDVPLYVGLVIIKVTKYGNHLSMESMVDSLQIEVSTSILSAAHLLNDVIRDDALLLYQWLKLQRKKAESKLDSSVKEPVVPTQMSLQMNSLNVFLCHENRASVMLRCDLASIPTCSIGDISLFIVGVKGTYFFRNSKFHSITRSTDVSNEILHFNSCTVNFNLPLKNLVIEASERVTATWSYSAHLCVDEILRQAVGIFRRTGTTSSPPSINDRKRDGEEKEMANNGGVEVMLFFSCNLKLNLSSGHFTQLEVESFHLEHTKLDGLILKVNNLTMSTNEHPFLTVENMKFKSDKRGDRLRSERSILDSFQLPSNRSWLFSVESINFVFAYGFSFVSWFEEMKKLRKWMKMKYARKVAESDGSSNLTRVSPDVSIVVDSAFIQICDDPFEVKLGDNYELLCDESLENEKRLMAMNKRIEELRQKNTFISEEKVESLYVSLQEKMSQVYVQRANQLYSQSPMRSSLCLWIFQSVEVFILADPTLTSKQNIVKFIAEVNPESPMSEDVEFYTSFLRRIKCTATSVALQLRDFPQPMLHIEDWSICGRFCGVEKSGGFKGRKTATIDLGYPWGSMTITKNLPPLKYFYNINSEIKNYSFTYGSCWEPIAAQISLSLNKIVRPSSDPSPPLPFWDKWRNLFHGNMVINMDKSSWMCHASLDPYNTTEFMDWTWSNLVFKCVTGEISFQGGLEILLRTASKYDECCFVKWNALCLSLRLFWHCKGDPNDHHSITACSPEYIASLSNSKEHDTYFNFRSSSLTITWSMKSSTLPSSASSPINFSPMSPGDVFSPGPSSSPRCTFYSSTIRWLNHLKVCLGRIARPIRRGRYFRTPVTSKPKFNKHISCINISLSLPSLNCAYWSSFRRSLGVELTGGPMQLDASVSLTTKPFHSEGVRQQGLKRRPLRVAEIIHFDAQLESVVVWLSSQIHNKKAKFKSMETGDKRFLLSVGRVKYQRVEQDHQDKPKACCDIPLHQVEVHDLKAYWIPRNRDIVFALHDSYSKSQMLQRNLSADALKGIKLEPSGLTPRRTSRPSCQEFNFSPFSSASSATDRPGQADALLQKLINESGSKFVAVHEEITGGGVDVNHLQGYQVCQTDDVMRKNWIVTLVNSQVMLSGCETSGCIIVSTPRASLLSRVHSPILTVNNQVRSKTTMVGSIESMQYYATITSETMPESLRWLTTRDIEERQSVTNESPSLTLENIINDTDDVQTDISYIQRIISRCQCQFYWSWYGELEDDVLEVPLQAGEDCSDMMKTQEGIDAFTLIHHDLNICTNSLQYATALDIVNNLLLHVEPKKKELSEKLMDMRFKLQLSSDADQRTPIFVKQNHLRQLVEKMRALEKEIYINQRTCAEGEGTQELLRNLDDTKELINFLSEELAIMLSCYRESQLQLSWQRQATVRREAMMTRKIDLYLQHVEWRLNEVDGHVGISHIVLSNFLYTKAMQENDCGSHQLELGWCHVMNLLPEDHAYKDVLVPQDPLGGASLNSRRAIVRVLCKFKSPVGGISIKEHLEVNVAPLTTQMTARFYSVVMAFFFPGKSSDSDDENASDIDESASTSNLTVMPSKKKFASLRKKSCTMSSINDIDKMKERAAKNNMFIYIKISEVPLRVSYKSEKEKHIMNIRDFQFLSPMLEYHNETWSWHDLTMTLKRDCKKTIITQAVKQKLHIKSKSLFGDMMVFPRGVTGSDEDTDKTKLLLGLSVPDSKQKKSKKHSLFGK